MKPSWLDRSSLIVHCSSLHLRQLICATSLLFAVSSASLAQTSPSGSISNKGVISGRVVSEDGAGLPGITVTLMSPGKLAFNQRRTASTDEEGNFRFTELSPGAYSASTIGGRPYVPAPVYGTERTQPRLYRLGETITIRMIKGGVITGRVTNALGEPLIALTLSAILVRNSEGLPIFTQSTINQAYTDDRGIYRFYGLAPGTYIVQTNSYNYVVSYQTSPYDDDRSTFYPSSTRDTAGEVQVTNGGEATGIDIRYRGEAGYAISGKVAGGKQPVTIILMDANSGTQIASRSFYRPDVE